MLHCAWVSEGAGDTEKRLLATCGRWVRARVAEEWGGRQQVDRTLRFQIDQPIKDSINLDHGRIGSRWDGVWSGGFSTKPGAA